MKTKLIKLVVAVSIAMNVVMLGALSYITKLDKKVERILGQPNVVYLEKSETAKTTQPASGDAMIATAIK